MSGQTNMMDVLLLLLKAAVLQTGNREVHLRHDEVMKAQEMDLELKREGPIVKLKLKILAAPGDQTKIILPNDDPGLGLLR